ncbi:unnamed protein product [Prorocentrum cordatum]|uniref:tRNA/rRNA methyltransferase SpoU type domain-containing protein n=1 Tax=Prorocentrum cordatum TaxID=2364126 RepID=A0ABN9TIH0_9DINO|nr:unnamed protein product [Polarella glacialis]
MTPRAAACLLLGAGLALSGPPARALCGGPRVRRQAPAGGGPRAGGARGRVRARLPVVAAVAVVAAVRRSPPAEHEVKVSNIIPTPLRMTTVRAQVPNPSSDNTLFQLLLPATGSDDPGQFGNTNPKCRPIDDRFGTGAIKSGSCSAICDSYSGEPDADPVHHSISTLVHWLAILEPDLLTDDVLSDGEIADDDPIPSSTDEEASYESTSRAVTLCAAAPASSDHDAADTRPGCIQRSMSWSRQLWISATFVAATCEVAACQLLDRFRVVLDPGGELAYDWPEGEGGLPLAFLLDGLRSEANVGSIGRTAAAFGAAGGVWTLGATPQLSNASAATIHVEDALAAVSALREAGVMVWACEKDESARPLGEALRALPSTAGTMPPFALVFGNEREGVSPALQAACDATVELAVGSGRALNVGVAAGVTAFQVADHFGLAKGSPAAIQRLGLLLRTAPQFH